MRIRIPATVTRALLVCGTYQRDRDLDGERIVETRTWRWLDYGADGWCKCLCGGHLIRWEER